MNLEMTIFVPFMQEIVFIPTVLESLKRAWIQYIAFIIPIMFVVYHIILGQAFKSKILNAGIRNDIKDEI